MYGYFTLTPLSAAAILYPSNKANMEEVMEIRMFDNSSMCLKRFEYGCLVQIL